MRSELLNKERFAWLVGASVDSISMTEDESPISSVGLSNGGHLQVEAGSWRLSWPGGILACSEDHGHRFGLAAPIDSAKDAMAMLAGAHIADAYVREFAPDLVLEFENQLVLEVLVGSAGYECWHLYEPNGWHVIVHGSGEAHGFQDLVRVRLAE